MFDLKGYKVIYGDRVVKAIALHRIEYAVGEAPGCPDFKSAKTCVKPKFISVLCINEEGQLESIFDEAWMLQFLPIVSQEGAR